MLPLRPTATLGLVAAIAACTGITGENGGGGILSGGDACGATERQEFVGQRVDALNDVALPEDTRVLFPGSSTSTDDVPERLNITIGTDDTITRIYCG